MDFSANRCVNSIIALSQVIPLFRDGTLLDEVKNIALLRVVGDSPEDFEDIQEQNDIDNFTQQSVACIKALHACFPTINPNYADRFSGATPLIIAVRFPILIETLHACFPQINPNATDRPGYSALMRAAQSNQPDSIRALHACFPTINPDLPNIVGTTPYVEAMLNHNVTCMTTLLDCFPQINVKAALPRVHTLMISAIRSNNLTFFQALCQMEGVDLNQIDQSGSSVLSWAAQQGRHEFIAYLRNFPTIDVNLLVAGFTAFTYAIKRSQPNCMIELSKFPNFDVNMPNQNGDTALACATRYGSAECMTTLFTCFPALNIDTVIDADGCNILQLVIKKRHISVIKATFEGIIAL